MKVKMTKINVPVRNIKHGGICPTAGMVKKWNEPLKDFVEVESLLEFMNFQNQEFFEDCYVEFAAIDEFIKILSGTLKYKCSPDELEWV